MPKPSLDLGGFAGLNEGEARVKFEQQGPNEIPAQRKRGLLAIVLEVAREPMFIMLVVAGSVYLTLGETSDALFGLICSSSASGGCNHTSRKARRRGNRQSWVEQDFSWPTRDALFAFLAWPLRRF